MEQMKKNEGRRTREREDGIKLRVMEKCEPNLTTAGISVSTHYMTLNIQPPYLP
jgi:hypothetical protein